MQTLNLELPSDKRTQKCAAQHFGPWMIEEQWFTQAVSAINAGTFVARVPSADEGEQQPYEVHDGIAVIQIAGQMTKGGSSYGGASTINLRRDIRQAAADDAVDGILLHIDSPGGTVAGTADLAKAVRMARKAKPVRAHIDDLGASAAYWIASQTEHITANETALVGSIGTVAVVGDSSQMADKAGIKVHVISTGKHKGAFAPGSEVTEEQLAELQTEVNDLNEHFLAAVSKGRQMERTKLEAIADGRVFIASKAKAKGLIDAVATFDAAITSFHKEITAMELQEFQAFAATNPEAVNDLPVVKTAIGQATDDGFAAGRDMANKKNVERLQSLIDLKGASTQFAVEQFLAGHDADKATTILAGKLADELEATKAELAAAKATGEGQGAVAASLEDTTPSAQLTANAAESAWDNDPQIQRQFPNKALYVRMKSGELAFKTVA
jgi:signal peptide peptidase SppA